jgi:hypothetical protein
MDRLKTVRTTLLCATALGGTMVAAPALAQSEAQIQAIEQQIKALQAQLGQFKADLAKRDRAVKTAQQQAEAAKQQAAAANRQTAEASARAAEVSARAAEMSAHAAQIAAAPPNAPASPSGPPSGPPLGKGQFKVGELTVTLGGFAAAEGVYRSRNQSSSIATNFNTIPLPNSPNYHIPEYRETAQQSRLSLLTEGQLDSAQKLTAYVETDFLSAGTSSNSNESNSYTLRLRLFWAATTTPA